MLEEFDTAELRRATFAPEEFLSKKLGGLDEWNLILRLVQTCGQPDFEVYCKTLDLGPHDFHMKRWCVSGAEIDSSDSDFMRLVCFRAVALKLASLHLEIVEQHDLQVTDVAHAFSVACTSVTELRQAASEPNFSEGVLNLCKLLAQDAMTADAGIVPIETDTDLILSGPNRHGQFIEKERNHLDVDTLDFGLFTSFPGTVALLQQSMPVVWLTLMAMWPVLLKRHPGCNFVTLIHLYLLFPHGVVKGCWVTPLAFVSTSCCFLLSRNEDFMSTSTNGAHTSV